MAVDFGGGQGGEAWAFAQRGVKAEPAPANAKRHAAGPLAIFRQALSHFTKLVENLIGNETGAAQARLTAFLFAIAGWLAGR